jgi:hypothetical protein
MATIHTGTTMVPTKLELLTDWLPRQPWYLGEGLPTLSRAGGFRLDDPAGEVGIEFLLVTDDGGTTYSVPLTYRAAPLAGADDALVGTSEHGVLGLRWIYDGAHDPVLLAQLLAFVDGQVEAQHQSRSDTVDHTVVAHRVSASTAAGPRTPVIVRGPGRADDSDGVDRVEARWTGADGTEVRGAVVVLR